MPTCVKAKPRSECDFCGVSDRPNVAIDPTGGVYADDIVCVVCLAEWIDLATGWRITSNVRQALMVGNAGERFHHPERFVKPSKRTPREVLQNNRERRAANDANGVQSDVPNRHLEMWE